MKSSFKERDVKYRSVEIDELEAEHFERERVLVIFVRLLVFESRQFERQMEVELVQNHDHDQIQNGRRNAHDQLPLTRQIADLQRRGKEFSRWACKAGAGAGPGTGAKARSKAGGSLGWGSRLGESWV